MEHYLSKITSITSKIESLRTPEILASCIGFMDLTTLNPSDTHSSVAAFSDKVNQLSKDYPNYPLPASICVFPNFSQTVKQALKVEGVNITVVAGCFPASQSYLSVKILEAKLAVENGANEVDIVLALNHFLDGNYSECTKEISEIKQSIGDAHLKVILETGALLGSQPNIEGIEKVKKASKLAIEAGADFIKTSTGKMEPAATPLAAYIMCECIKEHYEQTGKKIGFKPAGGIATVDDALLYYAIVKEILGEEWLTPSLFRIGASRLLNNLLAAL